MNKTIIIFLKEKNHYSLLNSFLKLLINYHITIVTTNQVRCNMYISDNVECIIRNERSIYSVYDIKLLKKYDLIIYDEPYLLRDVVKLMIVQYMISFNLIIHNINTWYRPKYTFNMKHNIYLYLANKIKNKLKNIIVVGTNIKRYLSEIDNNVNVIVVPFNLNSPRKIRNKKNVAKLLISIPGNISDRRDYLSLLRTFDKYKLFEKVDLQLLGSPVGNYGAKVVAYCKQLDSKGIYIKYYTSFVDDKIFEKDLICTDLLCAYFDINFKTFRSQTEVYGKSKETGISSLAWRYSIPVLLPNNYIPIDEIYSQVLKFSDIDDLVFVIESLNKSILADLKLKANINNLFDAEYYTFNLNRSK